MNEADFSQKLRNELKKRLPHAVIFKHHNFYTAGVPDFSATLDRRTTWIEVKLLNNKPEDSPLQFETMKRLGRACYIIWDNEHKMGDLFWVYNARGYKACCVHSFEVLVKRLIANFIEEE